jgi:nucleotide-binding universal stress UspA family protein
MFKHILIPTDGSPRSDQAIAYGAAFAKEVGARVTVVMVTTPFPMVLTNPGFAPIPDNYRAQYEAASREVLQRTKESLKTKGFDCEVMQSDDESVHQGIIDTAKSQGCDLIVMASHGRRGLSAVVLGSETLKVLTHSTIPVLVYRIKS